MLPSVGRINEIHVIEGHGAQPENEKLFRIPDAQSGEVPVVFEELPARTIGVTEIDHVFGKHVADKPEFVSLVRGIGRHDQLVALVYQQYAASAWQAVELEKRKDYCQQAA